jgi:hypothetical protein
MITQALGHLQQWREWQAIVPATTTGFDGPPEAVGNYYIQPFMVALTLKSLIAWHEFRPDPRIPPAIKATVDFLIANVGNKPWYENVKLIPADAAKPWLFTTKPPAPDLNLLIAPAYAWLYKRGAGVVYQQSGDTLWSDGVKGAFLDNGKQFDQSYFWSFDYVTWRNQTPDPTAAAFAARAPVASKPAVFPADLPKSMRPSTKVFPGGVR